MNLFNAILELLQGSDDSMRIDAVIERLKKREEELRYKTIADGKREMHGDLTRLYSDLQKAIKEASENDEKSRTEQD